MFVISKFYKSYESFDDKENQRRLASRKLPELLCRRKCSFCSTIRIMNSNCPFKSLNCTLSKVIIAGLLFIVLIWVGVVKSVDGPKSSVLKVTDKTQVSFFVDNSSFSLVSFNYRLDAFGFLALSELASNRSNSSFGNYGLLDQLTALEWIKNNIHAFGGNPKKVTLFGADAGAASIIAHLTNPNSAGLFHSAWLVGPSVYVNQSFESASQHNHDSFMSLTNCKNVDCLRKLSPDNVTKIFLDKDDPSFRINDQSDLPIRGIFPLQLIVTVS